MENNSTLIESLKKKIKEADAAYNANHPIMSDKEYDDLWFQLREQEEKEKIFDPESPTQKINYEIVKELKKVKHNHLMLSLNKTKDISVIESFIKDKDHIAMLKMDGLTCSLRYVDGVLVSAETRGNGTEGEDVTHNAKVIPSIPKKIQYGGEVIIDGEIICSYNNFNTFQTEYRNPRNFASGSIRLLDSRECARRSLTFVAWDVVKGGKYDFLSRNLADLATQGFSVVPLNPSFIEKDISIEKIINLLKDQAKRLSYPIDGIVFKYDNIKEYEAAGHTDHHFKGGLAYKFYDETYATKLKYIDWTMGRTGVLTPVAVFDPVEIDGTEVSRASLHNVSIMKETLGDYAYVGEQLEIFKSNMIIPQVYSAGPKYDYEYAIAHGKVSANNAPEYCPICGKSIYFKEENGITKAYCENPDCEGKLINRLEHFAGKKGLDIKGFSKATFEKLIDWGWIERIQDIFTLKNHRTEWIQKPGFGDKSVDKILTSIEKASVCSTDKFICAIGIPLIGKVASVQLAKNFKDYHDFRKAIKEKDKRLYQIEGIGDIMISNLLDFDYSEADSILSYLNEQPYTSLKTNLILKDKIFCITGKVHLYRNRDDLKKAIEDRGGKVTTGVTSKTSYLINNDLNSTSSKNITAKKLNIPIINEEQFLALIKKLQP